MHKLIDLKAHMLPTYTLLRESIPQISKKNTIYLESLIIEYTSIALGLLSADAKNNFVSQLESSIFPSAAICIRIFPYLAHSTDICL